MSSKATLEPEVVETQVPVVTGLEAQTRGEIDVQIATAKRFPRSITTALQEATSLATMTEEVAESCFYALPRDGKTIEGPSARLAEIVASCWGNMRIEARSMGESDTFTTSRGTSWDLQRNVAIAFEVKRRITGRNNKRYNDDMIVVASNAASSIALRNAVLKNIPKAFWQPVYEAARKAAVGTAETLVNKRAKSLDYFKKLGVTDVRVFSVLQVKGLDDITLEHLATLKGLATAIRDGDTTIEEAFPVEVREPQRKSETAPTTDASAPPVAPADAAKPATTAPPAAASASPSTPTTSANDHVEKGVLVLENGTKWVEDGNGGYGEVTTNRGVYVTRDQKFFMSASTCEGSDTRMVLTWRVEKWQKKGKPVDVKVFVKLGLDEGAQQPELLGGEGGNA
jgi:hypothetical protein